MNNATTDQPVAIEVKGLTRSFGNNRAVDGLDLSIRRGELFSLLGPNGAGKTTAIRLLCCLLRPDGGQALIKGHDIRQDPRAVKRLIGVSPQETALAENLNAWENLSLIGCSHGLSADQVRRKSAELLELMDLAGRSKERVKNFSGGMQRRLSIAMALVSDPEVLFLDEPTLGLDPQSRAGMWEHIKMLKGNKTVVLTTHYLEEADPLGADIVEGLREIYDKVTVVEGGVEIRAEKLDPYEIQDFLRPRGVAVRSTQLKQTTLDEVFLHHTGRELRE